MVASWRLTKPSLSEQPVIELTTDHGELKVVPTPAGTRGYDDLRRAANREPLGRGVRPSVASIGDLARMASALGGEQHLESSGSFGVSTSSSAAAPAPRTLGAGETSWPTHPRRSSPAGESNAPNQSEPHTQREADLRAATAR